MTNPFETRLNTPITAKRAILSALAATGSPLSTTQLTQCGELFGVDAAAVRVALGRLVKKHDVVTLERGQHVLGKRGQPMLIALRRWIDLPTHTRPWEGHWVLVHTAHLGRTKRAFLRRRERALSLFGFAPWVSGLWLRPDNLSLDGSALRMQLVGLGLEEEAQLFTQASAHQPLLKDAAHLWPRQELEDGYRAAKDAMDTCLRRRDTLPLQDFASQTARIGSAVIALLTFDPLLPEELIDATLRTDVHCTMLEFDRIGKEALSALWASTASC